MNKIKDFYEKHQILVAVFWIVLYCAVMAPIKGEDGYASVRMLLALIVIAAAMTAFIKANHLEKRFGLSGWPKDTKRLLYLIPMWILATGNLWDGFSLSFQGGALLIASLSMILIGYVEEVLFRGFLLRGMLAEGKTVVAIVVSALTFGLGHIVNLFAGQASFETFMQVIFAVAWGFIFTMVAFKSGSIIPCIIAHAMIDVFSLYGADHETGDWISIIATIVVAIVYCLYLKKQKTEKTE